MEYDATQNSGRDLVASVGAGNGIAVTGSSGKVYVGGSSDRDVYSPLVSFPDAVVSPPSNIGKPTATLNGTAEANGKALTVCKSEYGLTPAYGATVPCVESSAEIGTDSAKVHANV